MGEAAETKCLDDDGSGLSVPEQEAAIDDAALPFCACGRRWSDCDGSRAGCSKRKTPPEARPHGVTIDASYDPADNKIRLRASRRLPRELYDRVRAAGFIWAPKQDLFVAPMWTPERADLAEELAGEIGDEDTSLVERAEERADRFEEYGEHRAADAESAHKAVAAIADGIPFGQPLLIGHHSERHARRDAEKIQSGMRRAVKMWETSQYWERRAAGALRLAKYKELPGVRHRRIKGLESDLRKQEKHLKDARVFLKFWTTEGLTHEQALKLANIDRALAYGTWGALEKHETTAAEAAAKAIASHEGDIVRHERWAAHFTNRLTYERAMLAEGGDIAVKAKGFDVQVGGQVDGRHGWAVVLRVNKARGEVNSYTVAGRWGKMSVGVEDVTDYKPPSEEDAAKVKKATKLAPLVNYLGEGFREMVKAEWDKRARYSDFYRTTKVAATETHGAHRLRVTSKGGGGMDSFHDVGVFITDIPKKDPPAPDGPKPELPRPDPLVRTRHERTQAMATEAATKFDAMKASLKAGVQVVSADQLFPTPPELCARMVALAGVEPGQRVLEPSAGTGNLVKAIEAYGGVVTAVEISPRLAPMTSATCADFLETAPEQLGAPFDAVIMNPPFKDAADVAHILHARSFLKPGGILVAICAGGPRQADKLKPLADTWEELPAGTFAGTGVRAVLLTMRSRP